jgi:3-hydroxyacyl-CoA dehydrogenase/enoyl-CoA hydratase/3-hydroxybutyryl-CoA epimerase
MDRLKDSGPARRIAAGRMRDEAKKQAPPEHYPAPNALIELWERHGGDFEAMKAAEIGSFARLMVSETAQNLIRVFFLRESLKGLAARPRGARSAAST